MKFILTFIFCSGMAGSCLPPIEHTGSYKDLYTCLDAGYNEKRIFIKFYCSPMQET
jgi:hypothetical protein